MAESAELTNTTPPMTAKQRVVIIPGDQSEVVIDGYEEKDFEKRKALRREWKRHEKREYALHDRSMMTEKSYR